MKKNILILSHRFPPAFGGGENHVYLISRELIKKGYDVTIYTTNSLTSEDIPSLPFFKRKVKKPNLLKEEFIDGIKVKRFDISFRYWSFNWIPKMFKELKNNIKDFDIIHTHAYHLFTSIVSCYYAKKWSKAFILTAHDLIIPKNLPLTAKFFKKLYDLSLGRWLIKNSLRLVALTEDHIPQYTERGGYADKIRIIPNGIELSKYINTKTTQRILAKHEIEDKDKVLLFVGRIEKYKGIQDVIEVIPEILKEFPEAKFIVVGKDYGYREELEKMGKKLNADGTIIFTGNVPEDELIGLYKRADIFVLPSKMEGFGIVLLEAMAAKTLCIAHPIPSVRKVIKNDKNGVLVKDKKELLNKILYYLDNIEERRRIEANALKDVEKYDIKNIVNSVEKVYEDALN